MADVVQFKVTLPEIDGQVESAFKERIKRGLEMDEEGGSLIQIMNSYILWKYRDDWRAMDG